MSKPGMLGNQKPVKYDSPNVCPVCGGLNKLTVTGTLEGLACEYDTQCSNCRDKNFWAYGFFEPRLPLEEGDFEL